MISFFLPATFHEIKFGNKECTFQEVLTRTQAGAKFGQSISFQIPKVSIENVAWLYENVATRWIAFFQDHAGRTRILGDPSLPCELSFSSVVNSDSSSAVSLSCESSHPAYFTDSMPDLERIFSPGFGESFG
jgi:hypothetical protein